MPSLPTVARHALAGVLLSTLVACATAHPMPAAATAAKPAAPVGTRQRAAGAVPDEATRAVAPADDRRLVRTGDMRLTTDDVLATARAVERAGEALGGRVAASDVGGARRATVTLQVPAARLDSAMDRIAALGAVTARHTRTVDVTDQMVDLAARRATLAATRDRLRALLERAQAIPDVVAVERELSRVQGELESLERRLAALDGQVAMSDLSVTVERRVVLGPVGAVLRGVGLAVSKLFVWR